MPVFITLLITKFVLKSVRLLGQGGGSALPGLIAERMDPIIAAKLAPNLAEGAIVVTGTNGKTTTTKMIRAILEQAGHPVITNRSGSNLYRGVVSALIEKASLAGRFQETIGLFEVDEASMPMVCATVQPRIVIVLNLFRDQLDRYGELDTTAALIGKSLTSLDAEVWLNADDPLVASLSKYVKNPKRVHYFGVQAATVKKLAHDVTADSSHCPNDGLALKYSKNFFGHIGHYKCPKRDTLRPKPELAIASYQEGKPVKIGTQAVNVPLPGLYNAYNALGALAVARSLSIAPKVAVGAVEAVTAAFGRVEQLAVEGRRVYLLLIKNPTGFNQVLQTFLIGAKPSQVLIAINDNFADGRDVSWLWDVGFEELAKKKHKILTSGIRAADMALRLKYAGLESEITEDLSKAFKQLIAQGKEGETVYVLPTYTAMLELRSKLGVKEFWT